MKPKTSLLFLLFISILFASGFSTVPKPIFVNFHGLSTNYVYTKTIDFIKSRGWDIIVNEPKEKKIIFCTNRPTFGDKKEENKIEATTPFKNPSSVAPSNNFINEFVPNKTLKERVEIIIEKMNDGARSNIIYYELGKTNEDVFIRDYEGYIKRFKGK